MDTSRIRPKRPLRFILQKILTYILLYMITLMAVYSALPTATWFVIFGSTLAARTANMVNHYGCFAYAKVRGTSAQESELLQAVEESFRHPNYLTKWSDHFSHGTCNSPPSWREVRWVLLAWLGTIWWMVVVIIVKIVGDIEIQARFPVDRDWDWRNEVVHGEVDGEGSEEAFMD